MQGLRTLVVAGKEIEEDEWAAWDARYQQAAADLDRRDERVRGPPLEVACICKVQRIPGAV
jgi:hypothetical protein